MGGQVGPNTGGSSSSTGILYIDKQITNAQMLALVSNPPVLLNGEAGFAKLVVGAYALANLTTGYTIPAGSFLLITTPAARAASTFDGFCEQASAGILDQTGILPFTFIGNLVDGFNANPLNDQPAGTGGGPLTLAKFENQAVVLTNDRAGELTGGNAANTLSLRVWYVKVPTVSFGV